jgi:hypothetical protein
MANKALQRTANRRHLSVAVSQLNRKMFIQLCLLFELSSQYILRNLSHELAIMKLDLLQTPNPITFRSH